MADDTDTLLVAITAVIVPILTALERLNYVGRYLHPPALAVLVESLSGTDDAVKKSLGRFRDCDWPEQLLSFKEQVETAAESVCQAVEELRASVSDSNGVFKAYQALRSATRAAEVLYPMSVMLLPVSKFFLEPEFRDDQTVLAKLADSDPGRDNVGVMHADNAKGSRGSFSLYVPEYYDASAVMPLIMAMHGGSGNGASFLWTWIREARSRGAVLISPTARGRTWSLMGPDVDSANLDGIVERVSEDWSIDRDKMLLTGMSDGGTFAYLSGLREESPFTHLAPSSASFHPLMLEGFSPERLKGLPIYLIHGVLDWMFPVDVARTANQALRSAGANVVYREIEDLSHTYPRDENPRIMDWFLDTSREE